MLTTDGSVVMEAQMYNGRLVKSVDCSNLRHNQIAGSIDLHCNYLRGCGGRQVGPQGSRAP